MEPARRQLSVRLSLSLAAVSALFLLIGGAAEAHPPPGTAAYYVVEPGDTLWGIAHHHSLPGEDLRRVVTDIRELNGLDSSLIYPGQALQIPRP